MPGVYGQSFTGSSRRLRKIDLSGQRNANPWAASSSTSDQLGPNKTVVQAQAERERRHREREELAAAKRLQRLWRGHRDRQKVKNHRRAQYDQLYQQPNYSVENARQRITHAFLLFLAFYTLTNPADQPRLDLIVTDVLSIRPVPPSSIDPNIFSPLGWDKLARILVAALPRHAAPTSTTLLPLITEIVKMRPTSIRPVLKTYYNTLAKITQNLSYDTSSQAQDHLALLQTITAPLVRNPDIGFDISSYQVFAYSFLTSSNLWLVQQLPVEFSQAIDLETLSKSIIGAFSQPSFLSSATRDKMLWLLAHFIALNRALPDQNQSFNHTEALYLQISLLSADIRSRLDPPKAQDTDDLSDDDNDASVKKVQPLAQYVANQLKFLINEDNITGLLGVFASTTSKTTEMSREYSLLAGYTLVLFRCFPSHCDDIKMRLFQGDVPTNDLGTPLRMPTVKFLWKAASRTSIFSAIAQPSMAQENWHSVAAFLKQDTSRDWEWRTLLLFLELYVFLLRLTDDEDFLPRETQLIPQQSHAAQRIRASGLNLEELKSLVLFLKHLCFPLYYNLLDIMRAGIGPGHFDFTVSTSTAGNLGQPAPPSFANIIGMDVKGLRDLASSAMHALYERDSRRSFLPQDFWLMTEKFDMKNFIAAVMAEEARQINEEEDDDSDDMESISPRIQRARFDQWREGFWREEAEPKLEILRNMPFTIPFNARVDIFRRSVWLDKQKRRNGFVDPDQWRISMMARHSPDRLGRHNASVRRDHVFEDALKAFYSLGESIKEPIQITFVDQFDQPEAGIDGGGVTKEFLISVTNDAFNPQRMVDPYFVSNEQNLLYPSPSIFDNSLLYLKSHGLTEDTKEWKQTISEITKRYEFLGRIVGKCMYEEILIDISFANFFLLKWSSSGDYRANLNDLRDLDPALYQGLMSLKNYPGDVADLSVDFTITDEYFLPSRKKRTITRPLRENGANIPVTNKDRPLYIYYVAHHRLVAQQRRQTKAFLRGLGSIINPQWLSMFNQLELQRLVGGDSSEIDIDDLRNNTIYSGFYQIGDDGQEHPTIKYFWEVMKSFKDSERREVLKYVTSTPRAPLLGFSQLKPKFSIRNADGGDERLPSTSTCVNLLKLPVYTSAHKLRKKLLYAIQSGAGFDLS
ncbi:hypothetical protein F5Y16DRAFT_366136 [Xylariaceae sp. FL0255]|nr:hypothetical protein F5Y16DRAFT_366136 [Xylariaceae sp. FL0255]